MALPPPRERLQPALLDRLTDLAPQHAAGAAASAENGEAAEQRVMSKSQLRAAVLRDLGWLFNAVQPLGNRLDDYPEAQASVLNYGLPPIAGQLASKIDINQIERNLRDAILRFEPRLLLQGLTVRAVEDRAVLDTHNVIEFEIRGYLWAQPVPLELLLRTELDLEAGQVRVRDLASAGAA